MVFKSSYITETLKTKILFFSFMNNPAYGEGYEVQVVERGKLILPQNLQEIIKIKNQGLPQINQDILHVSEIPGGHQYRAARDFLRQFFDADGNTVSPTIETLLSAKTTKTPIKEGKIVLPELYKGIEEVLVLYYQDHFVITQPENLPEFI